MLPLLYIRALWPDDEYGYNAFAFFLQDEKSLPKDFGPPDRAAALPREYTSSLVLV